MFIEKIKITLHLKSIYFTVTMLENFENHNTKLNGGCSDVVYNVMLVTVFKFWCRYIDDFFNVDLTIKQ